MCVCVCEGGYVPVHPPVFEPRCFSFNLWKPGLLERGTYQKWKFIREGRHTTVFNMLNLNKIMNLWNYHLLHLSFCYRSYGRPTKSVRLTAQFINIRETVLHSNIETASSLHQQPFFHLFWTECQVWCFILKYFKSNYSFLIYFNF